MVVVTVPDGPGAITQTRRLDQVPADATEVIEIIEIQTGHPAWTPSISVVGNVSPSGVVTVGEIGGRTIAFLQSCHPGNFAPPVAVSGTPPRWAGEAAERQQRVLLDQADGDEPLRGLVEQFETERNQAPAQARPAGSMPRRCRDARSPPRSTCARWRRPAGAAALPECGHLPDCSRLAQGPSDAIGFLGVEPERQ